MMLKVTVIAIMIMEVTVINYCALTVLQACFIAIISCHPHDDPMNSLSSVLTLRMRTLMHNKATSLKVTTNNNKSQKQF